MTQRKAWKHLTTGQCAVWPRGTYLQAPKRPSSWYCKHASSQQWYTAQGTPPSCSCKTHALVSSGHSQGYQPLGTKHSHGYQLRGTNHSEGTQLHGTDHSLGYWQHGIIQSDVIVKNTMESDTRTCHGVMPVSCEHNIGMASEVLWERKSGAPFPLQRGNGARKWTKASDLRAMSTVMLMFTADITSMTAFSFNFKIFLKHEPTVQYQEAADPVQKPRITKTRVTTLEMSKKSNSFIWDERWQWRMTEASKHDRTANVVVE